MDYAASGQNREAVAGDSNGSGRKPAYADTTAQLSDVPGTIPSAVVVVDRKDMGIGPFQCQATTIIGKSVHRPTARSLHTDQKSRVQQLPLRLGTTR
jgi:hypothetical protein